MKGTYIEYSKNEKILLSYLSENSDISLSKFIRISKITKYEAEKILINLASLNVININISEKGVKYSLKIENNFISPGRFFVS